MTTAPIGNNRLDEVLGLLGLTDRPAIDPVGLHAVYSAWCRSVPFDNVQKLLAISSNVTPLPGTNPVEFFDMWQKDGTGGTCWSSNNALHALLVSAGFDATCFAASMFDGEINHGTTVVAIDDQRWVVDTAVHGDVPVPLIDGEARSVSHAGYQTRARHDAKGHIIEHPTPDPGVVIPCRILEPMGHEETLIADERSRTWSPFNTGVMAAINDATGVWMLKDNSLTRVDARGVHSSVLTATDVDEFLVDVIGCSSSVVTDLRSAL